MAEWCLIDRDNPPAWTRADWHNVREFVPQYGTPVHTPRINLAARVVMDAVRRHGVRCVVELGAHDGGLYLAMGKLGEMPTYWGYEIGAGQPVAEAAGIDVRRVNIETDDMDLGEQHRPNLVVATEVLEHLRDPHGMVRSLQPRADYLVVSSPYAETPEHHYEYHAWAWDKAGYERLLVDAGFRVLRREYLASPIDTQVLLTEAIR